MIKLKSLLKEHSFFKGRDYFKYGRQARQIIDLYTPMHAVFIGQTERVKLYFSKKAKKWLLNIEQFNYKNSAWQTLKTLEPFSKIMDSRGWDLHDE